MSREIKFRAVDKETNEIYDGERIEADTSIIVTLSYGQLVGFYVGVGGDYEELILNQWTGLYDKNGKEIYEGDVLKVPDWYDLPENTSMTYNNQVVTFENCSFCLDGDSMHEDYEYISEECEVIGNIFEHSHLLEGDIDA